MSQSKATLEKGCNQIKSVICHLTTMRSAAIQVLPLIMLVFIGSGCVNAKANSQAYSSTHTYRYLNDDLSRPIKKGSRGSGGRKWSGANRLDREMVMAIVIEEANEQEFDPALALAIAQVESNFNPRAVSHAGARGVMQIMPKTARYEFGLNPILMFDARTNIQTGITFVKQLMQRYGDVKFALSHYNGGSRVVKADGSFQIIPATKNYVDKVLAKHRSFKRYMQKKYLVGQPKTLLASAVKTDYSNEDSLNVSRMPKADSYNQDSVGLSYRKTQTVAKKYVKEGLKTTRRQSRRLNQHAKRVDPQAKPRKRQFRDNIAQLSAATDKRAQVLEWESIYSK